jgi:hypothetical protein
LTTRQVNIQQFIDSAYQIPDVGKLELSWVPNDAFGGIKASNAEVEAHDSDGESSATIEGEEKSGENEVEEHGGAVDADMDVAEDEDQWL